MSIDLVMPSNYRIFCHLLLPPPSIFPSIRAFSNKSALRIRWPKYYSHRCQPQFKSKEQHCKPAAASAKSLQSCPTLCDPIDGSPSGSPVPGILQARTLGCHFLLQCVKVKRESEVAQSCATLSDPMDCSLPGSSAHGTSQVRVLEWVAIAFSDNIFTYR